MLSTEVNKQWPDKKQAEGGWMWGGVGGVSQQLPDFYVLLIKPLLIASRTPFITEIYLTLSQSVPTYESSA